MNQPSDLLAKYQTGQSPKGTPEGSPEDAYETLPGGADQRATLNACFSESQELQYAIAFEPEPGELLSLPYHALNQMTSSGSTGIEMVFVVVNETYRVQLTGEGLTPLFWALHRHRVSHIHPSPETSAPESTKQSENTIVTAIHITASE